VEVNVTAFGLVRGYEQQAINKKVHTFLGIPFARPPIGHLRFGPPEPLPAPAEDGTWPDYDATNLPASCFQTVDTEFEPRLVDTWNPNTNMSEDCLYLNIWQPQTATNKAVMVRFHFVIIRGDDLQNILHCIIRLS